MTDLLAFLVAIAEALWMWGMLWLLASILTAIWLCSILSADKKIEETLRRRESGVRPSRYARNGHSSYTDPVSGPLSPPEWTWPARQTYTRRGR